MISVLEINQIHHGDCLDVMYNIEDKSVDMILCDLPYGTTACKWDTIIPFDSVIVLNGWKFSNHYLKKAGHDIYSFIVNDPVQLSINETNNKFKKFNLSRKY